MYLYSKCLDLDLNDQTMVTTSDDGFIFEIMNVKRNKKKKKKIM